MSAKFLVGGVVLAFSLAAAPASASERECPQGSALMTDLGFRPLVRSMSSSGSGKMEMSFPTEPRITGVRKDGPAAGRLFDGDVVVAIEGYPITTPQGAQLYGMIRPGDRIRISVRRGGNLHEVSVTAAGRCVATPPEPHAPPAPPPPPAPPAPPVPPNPAPDELMPSAWLGFLVECRNCGRDPSTGVLRFMEYPIVTSVAPGSAVSAAGIRAGDQLKSLNGLPLTDSMGWARFYAIQPGEKLQLEFAREDDVRKVEVTASRRP